MTPGQTPATEEDWNSIESYEVNIIERNNIVITFKSPFI